MGNLEYWYCEIEAYGLEGMPPIEPTTFTCYYCQPFLKIGMCEWQFDSYNTDGDCLAIK